MKIFSSDFVKKEIVEDNIILFFLYVIASPLSKVFAKLKISPNAITYMSILCAILSFIALVVNVESYYFYVFWTLSLHLDFCDGSVARMTGNINKTAFRFDHMSDIFKLSLVIVGGAIHYNEFSLWIISMATLFSFLYMMILNHDTGSYAKIKALVSKNNTDKKVDKQEVNGLLKKIMKYSLLRNFISFFLTMNGHTLLFFLVIPCNITLTKVLFFYIIILTSLRSVKVINRLVHLPKIKI